MNDLETKTVVVRLENEEFAISIQHVLSIEKMLPITKVPNYPDYVKGVVNLRNTVIPIIDLKYKLMGIHSVDSDKTRIIVIKIAESQMGLIVDEATEVLDIANAEIQESSLSHLDNSGRTVKIVKVDGRMLILLETEYLFKPNENIDGVM